MTFTSTARAAFAATFISLFAIGGANAGAIYTPMLYLGDNDQLVCIVNNVSPGTVNVVVSIRGVGGSATENCLLAANDKPGCAVFRNNDSGYCRITIKTMSNAEVAAAVRGSMFARKTSPPLTIGPIVQAQ